MGIGAWTAGRDRSYVVGMYAEERSSLPGLLRWIDVPEREHVILPDGCIDIYWDGADVQVAGPDRYATTAPVPEGGRYVGLRFPPGAAPSVLGCSAAELTDRRVLLRELWGDGPVDAARDRLAYGTSDGIPAQPLEDLVATRLAAARPQPMVKAMVAAAVSGRPVGLVARRWGLSERTVHRRALDAFGYGPKRLAAILRLQRALRSARAGRRSAEAAAIAGYADQSHLARDARKLTGRRFTEIV